MIAGDREEKHGEVEAAAAAGAGREAEVDTPASASQTPLARSRDANRQPMESFREGAGRTVTGRLDRDFRSCA